MNRVPPPSLPDVLGYRESRWGMTAAEIHAAVGDELRSLRKREEFQDLYADYVLPLVEIAGTNFTGVFQLSPQDDRLAQVLLRCEQSPHTPDLSLFLAVEALLVQKYGTPTTEGPTPGGETRTWVFPTTTIALTFMFIPRVYSQVSIVYRPTQGAAGRAPARASFDTRNL